MDTDVKDPNCCKSMPLISVDSLKEEVGADGEEDNESNSLLLPRRKGGMSKRPRKPQLKVQWKDRNGNKLVEVLEFQPSDQACFPYIHLKVMRHLELHFEKLQ
ncbi:hypothetical protein HHK36_012917 [Tetracentron sinense]|uniref:Uncharacterized protein n=1 Tax=Tetracentron sinense TaxID=13715 RepID=A0A834Z9Z8_TETSI|nr:hypothetical protein HHK36_012917 [Tetracentron sinense]